MQGVIKVKLVTLEDIFSLYRIEKIDLLKVDIEGEEWNLFESFSKHDFVRIKQISVEFHDLLDPALREKSERCIKLLNHLDILLFTEEQNSCREHLSITAFFMIEQN